MTRRQLITFIGELRTKGVKAYDIAARLNKLGSKTPTQGKDWTPSNVNYFMRKSGNGIWSKKTKRKKRGTHMAKAIRQGKVEKLRSLSEDIWTSSLKDEHKHKLMEYIYA